MNSKTVQPGKNCYAIKCTDYFWLTWSKAIKTVKKNKVLMLPHNDVTSQINKLGLQRQTVNTMIAMYQHTHTRLTALCPRVPRWAGTRKVKPIWILLEQETVSASGISWAICKSAPCSRQITTPAPHNSVFYRPDALPAAQPTASKHWRSSYVSAIKNKKTYWISPIKSSSLACSSCNCSQKFPGFSICDTWTSM